MMSLFRGLIAYIKYYIAYRAIYGNFHFFRYVKYSEYYHSGYVAYVQFTYAFETNHYPVPIDHDGYLENIDYHNSYTVRRMDDSKYRLRILFKDQKSYAMWLLYSE